MMKKKWSEKSQKEKNMANLKEIIVRWSTKGHIKKFTDTEGFFNAGRVEQFKTELPDILEAIYRIIDEIRNKFYIGQTGLSLLPPECKSFPNNFNPEISDTVQRWIDHYKSMIYDDERMSHNHSNIYLLLIMICTFSIKYYTVFKNTEMANYMTNIRDIHEKKLNSF